MRRPDREGARREGREIWRLPTHERTRGSWRLATLLGDVGLTSVLVEGGGGSQLLPRAAARRRARHLHRDRRWTGEERSAAGHRRAASAHHFVFDDETANLNGDLHHREAAADPSRSRQLFDDD
jgi:hypothetical protein